MNDEEEHVDAQHENQTQPHHQPSRGFYSEDMVLRPIESIPYDPSTTNFKRVATYPMLNDRMLGDRFTPILKSIHAPTRTAQLKPALRWKQYNTRVQTTFPIQTIKPKVQLLLRAAAGEIPREVEVERRLRRYGRHSITEMLEQAGIELWDLIPPAVRELYLTADEQAVNFNADQCRFPLEWFDDFDTDCMQPEDWLNLGILNGERHPLPADAFVPNQLRLSVTSSASDAIGCGINDDTNDDEDYHSNIQQISSTANKPSFLAGLSAESTSKSVHEASSWVYRKNLYHWVRCSVHAYDEQQRRWQIIDLQTGRTFRIPRIQLRFLAEDPAAFVQRIQLALRRRANADRRMKLGLVVDSVLVAGVPRPAHRLVEKIRALSAQSGERGKQREARVRHWLETDVVREYQRTMAGIELMSDLRGNEDNRYGFLEMPDDDGGRDVDGYLAKRHVFDTEEDCRIENFQEAYDWLRINTLYCLPSVCLAMDNVVVECADVARRRFFTTQFAKNASLEDFKVAQEAQTTMTLQFIRGSWVDHLSALVCMCLRGTGKGWFDLRTNNWGIYGCAKISRLMELIRWHQQTALRDLVEGSIGLWMTMLCRPCDCLLSVADDFEWDAMNVIDSPFRPEGLHVFYVVLVIDEELGPRYTTEPTEYGPVLMKLFDEPLRKSHLVRRLDGLVMSSLRFANDLCLSSVGMLEAVVADAGERLRLSYERLVIPLRAYLVRYEQYSEFYLMDKGRYLREFKEAKKSPQEYQDEISMHLRMKASLEVTLPSSIQIGPVLVNTDTLKVSLVLKRQDLATRLTEQLMEKLKMETQAVVDEYEKILKRLTEKPLSIEMVFSVREWMETLPETITQFETQMRLKLFEYDILDHFYVALPNEDFRVKWNALAMPMRCFKQMKRTHEMHVEETERFLKQQTADLVSYDERIESLNMTVSQFSSQNDTSKTTEIAIDIKKLWKALIEATETGRLLNKRQLLFECPEIDLRPMDALRDSFAPYRTLWVNGADFLKWEESWTGNPLVNVDVDKVRMAVTDFRAAFVGCIEVFRELPRVMEVAEFFCRGVAEAEPRVDMVEWIKNPAWIQMYWQEFTKRTGVEIKVTAAMNFEYCLTKGIAQHYDVVREISEKATANRERLEAEAAEEERLRRLSLEAIEERKNRRRGRKLT